MGVNRYQFAVYKQTRKINARFNLEDVEKRGGFNTMDFINENALDRIVAFNSYTAKKPIQ